MRCDQNPGGSETASFRVVLTASPRLPSGGHLDLCGHHFNQNKALFVALGYWAYNINENNVPTGDQHVTRQMA